MNWLERMHLATEYIENNLAHELDISEVAKIACSSKYHFHRMFFSYVGVTFSEYVRKRRLTLAASEIALGKDKIIDIATKYGYDSPNAFTRAFRKLHGINPSATRSQKASLIAYSRATLNTEIIGGQKVDYKVIEKPEITIMGKSKQFEFEQFIKDGPKFWKQYVSTEEYKHLLNHTKARSGKLTEASLMSVYIPQEDGSRDQFQDFLAVEVAADTKIDGVQTYTIPAATYAEFDCTYQNSMKTNRYIYGEWFASTGYERDTNKPDIAAYFPKAFRPMSEMGVRWWIPIIKK